jgi:cytoplasmic FMR1 interacting protein
LQYLIHELVSGGSPKHTGGFFSGNDVDIPPGDMRQLENFFNRLAFFPHILDYRGKFASAFTFAPSLGPFIFLF